MAYRTMHSHNDPLTCRHNDRIEHIDIGDNFAASLFMEDMALTTLCRSIGGASFSQRVIFLPYP